MKRKAIGVLVFCLALFGAIVAGYWDLLNSAGLRLAEERAQQVVTRLSGTGEPEVPADELAARESGAGDESPAGSASVPAVMGEEATPAVTEPDAAADVAVAAGKDAAEAPANGSAPTTIIVPVGPAVDEGGLAPDDGQQVAVAPAETASGEGAPLDGAAAGEVADPARRIAAAPDAPGGVGQSSPVAGGAPAETGGSERGPTASGPAGGDAGTADAAAGTAGADEPLAAPRFDILRIETDGSTVIAGRAPAGSTVALVDTGRPLASETASAAGEFVLVLDEPLASGDYQMRLEASLPDGRRVISDEIAIVSVPQAGSENELLAMVEAPDAASRLISVPSALPQASDAASAESLPAEEPADPRGATAGLLLPQTAELEAADARTAIELPERVSTFFSRARALSSDAGNLDDDGTAAEALAVARDAASVAEEGRALVEELPLAQGTQEGGEAELSELVREAADAAGDVAEEAGSLDLEQAADAADRLAGLAGEAGTRLASPGEERVEPSGRGGGDADGASAAVEGAAGTLAVEAVEIEDDTIYIAGRAKPGSTVRIYLDNDYLADDKVAAGNRFLVAKNASVATGQHLVRADQVDPNGTVTARAEVPFFKPEGALMSAVAPLAPTQDTGAGAGAVEMLPTTESRPALPAADDGQRAEADGGSAGDGAQGDAGADLGAATTASADAAVPSASGEVGEASSGETEPAGAGPAEPSAARAGGLIPAGAPAPDADRPASGGKAPGYGGDTVAPSSEVTSATSLDPAAPIAALAPGDEIASAPGNAASSREASEPPASPADGAALAVNRQPQLEPADTRVIIRKGDTLWEISRDTYGRGSRYTAIYLANGDQIRNPDRIYPGQVFRLPDNLLDVLDSSGEAN